MSSTTPTTQYESTIPDMTSSTKTMMARVKSLVPPMLDKFHKGQLGRVAVIGGSADYTGAPYFSAMASARLGCDLSYVICESSASQTIKTYSPNLMVSPLLCSSRTVDQKNGNPTAEELASPILDMLPRLHVLVIGPGLGRDEVTLKQVAAVIKAARSRDPPIPMVLDADALFLINSQPDLVKGYKDCILTPNVVEFARLAKSLGVDVDKGDSTKLSEQVARALEGVCIIQKGREDYISNGESTTICDFQGGLKRSGGQGDTLTGSLGTFLAWREAYHEGLWEGQSRERERMSKAESLLSAAFGGSTITRECSRRAFEKKGRSLQASDLTDEVHGSFLTLVGEPAERKS